MATTARVGVDIVGTDKTRAAFASANNGLASFNRSLTQIKGVMAGFAGGNLLAGFTRSMVSINKEVPVVKQAIDRLQASWVLFGQKVGESGLNDALVNFANRMAGMVAGTDGLSASIGAFMGGAVNVMAGVFEGIGRSIAFVYDNMAAFGRLLAVVGLVAFGRQALIVAGNMVLFYRSLATLGRGMAAFSLISRASTATFLLIAAGIGYATDSLDDMAAVVETVASKVREAFPDAFATIKTALGDLGLDTRAFNAEFANSFALLGSAAAVTAPATEALKKHAKQTKAASAATQELSLYSMDLPNALKPMADSMEQIGQTFSSGLSQAFGSLIEGSKSAKAAFADMAKGILNSLASLAVNSLFSNIFSGALGGGKGLGGLFGGFRAAGGSVSGGKAYMVGEKGPELFLPGQSGSIIPNHQMGGGTVVNITINAPNADAGGLAAVRAEVQRLKTELPRTIKSVVTGEKRASPRFAT